MKWKIPNSKNEMKNSKNSKKQTNNEMKNSNEKKKSKKFLQKKFQWTGPHLAAIVSACLFVGTGVQACSSASVGRIAWGRHEAIGSFTISGGFWKMFSFFFLFYYIKIEKNVCYVITTLGVVFVH